MLNKITTWFKTAWQSKSKLFAYWLNKPSSQMPTCPRGYSKKAWWYACQGKLTVAMQLYLKIGVM